VIQPRKIEDPDLIKKLTDVKISDANKTNSAWNKAGTWENRDLKID